MKTMITLDRYDICGNNFEYKWRDEYSMMPELALLSYDEREKMKNIIKKVLSSLFDEEMWVDMPIDKNEVLSYAL